MSLVKIFTFCMIALEIAFIAVWFLSDFELAWVPLWNDAAGLVVCWMCVGYISEIIW